MWRCLALVVVIACGPPPRDGSPHDASTAVLDGFGVGDDSGGGGGNGDGGGGGTDGGGGGGTDGGGGGMDGGIVVTPDAAPAGVITGGPCSSGSAGATAYRIRWAGNGSGSTAYPVYEVHGLPDTSPNKAGAYGYQIGFTPTFVDPFLGQGGLQLDGSSFVDLELSLAGIASITKATLSIYGRSFNTTASGSFNWQTVAGVGATATNFVSNVAPYAWYSANMTTELTAGNDNVRIRIKAGPNSGSLVVHRIELCVQAT